MIGQPLHLRIGQLLVVAPENLAHRQVVFLAIDMRNGTSQLGQLIHVMRAFSGIQLVYHQVDTAHIAVLLKLEHIAGAVVGFQIQHLMIHEVTD